jgi:Fe-S-cluster containining protein
MLLSTEDIERLERKGYQQGFFVLLDREGYPKLRNLQNHCVFFNVENKRCMIYHSRPLGCRLYPLIYDEQRDNCGWFCRAKGKLPENQMAQRGRKVLRLLERLMQKLKDGVAHADLVHVAVKCQSQLFKRLIGLHLHSDGTSADEFS